jgi:hypothetical protein
MKRDKTSKYKGVCRSKDKWKTRFMYNGNEHNIGTFKTQKEAHEARQSFILIMLLEGKL